MFAQYICLVVTSKPRTPRTPVIDTCKYQGEGRKYQGEGRRTYGHDRFNRTKGRRAPLLALGYMSLLYFLKERFPKLNNLQVFFPFRAEVT